jgi:hypothetical protein
MNWNDEMNLKKGYIIYSSQFNNAIMARLFACSPPLRSGATAAIPHAKNNNTIPPSFPKIFNTTFNSESSIYFENLSGISDFKKRFFKNYYFFIFVIIKYFENV